MEIFNNIARVILYIFIYGMVTLMLPCLLVIYFLEDVNLSSPECYAKPLLDVVRVIRKRIPYAESSYPQNLRILMTKASVEDPAIGLPVIQDTFDCVGFYGFGADLTINLDKECEFDNSILTSEFIMNNINSEDNEDVELWSANDSFFEEQ